MASASLGDHIRYEPEEKCSILSSFVVGAQGIMLVLPPAISVVVVTVLAAGLDAEYLTWAMFAALLIIAAVTALQASRIGRLGAGHLAVTGVTPNYIALAVLALAEGGPAMLASLMVVSSLFFFAVATWLPQLRRVLTPAVSGTVLMLIAVSVLPFCLDRFDEVPDGALPFAGAHCGRGDARNHDRAGAARASPPAALVDAYWIRVRLRRRRAAGSL